MAALGPMTVHCGACDERYEIPVQAVAGPERSDHLTVALHIADADRVLLRQWAASHRGPLAPARMSAARCPHGDPACPCPDGDACHYRDYPAQGRRPASKAMPCASPDCTVTEPHERAGCE